MACTCVRTPPSPLSFTSATSSSGYSNNEVRCTTCRGSGHASCNAAEQGDGQCQRKGSQSCSTGCCWWNWPAPVSVDEGGEGAISMLVTTVSGLRAAAGRICHQLNYLYCIAWQPRGIVTPCVAVERFQQRSDLAKACIEHLSCVVCLADEPSSVTAVSVRCCQHQGCRS